MCEAASRGSLVSIDLYGYCISIWYCWFLAKWQDVVFQGHNLLWSRMYISPFQPVSLPAMPWFKDYIVDQDVPLLSLFKGQFQNLDLAFQPNKQASWLGGPARPFGISAKNCIFPSVQQGQVVMSVPVMWSIISSRVATSFSSGAGTPINCLMVFKFSFRLRLAIKP